MNERDFTQDRHILERVVNIWEDDQNSWERRKEKKIGRPKNVHGHKSCPQKLRTVTGIDLFIFIFLHMSKGGLKTL